MGGKPKSLDCSSFQQSVMMPQPSFPIRKSLSSYLFTELCEHIHSEAGVLLDKSPCKICSLTRAGSLLFTSRSYCESAHLLNTGS